MSQRSLAIVGLTADALSQLVSKKVDEKRAEELRHVGVLGLRAVVPAEEPGSWS
jgi:hypothetical protein